MRICVQNSLVQRNSKKYYDFQQEIHIWFLLKTSDLLSFALIINSDESQGKAQFNTLSIGENKTGYRAENRFFPQMNFSRNVHICLHRFLYPPDNVLLRKGMAVRYQFVQISCYATACKRNVS